MKTEEKTIVNLTRTTEEQLSLCIDALLKIAEVEQPLEATGQADWRRRAVCIAKKALNDANFNVRMELRR